MANLVETVQWENGVYQLETTDPVLGGENGISNLQARQLGNRTAFLKSIIEDGQNITNANLAVLGGNYFIADTGTNAPTADAYIISVSRAGINISQLAKRTQGDAFVYARYSQDEGATWSSWFKLADLADLASLKAGIDAVINSILVGLEGAVVSGVNSAAGPGVTEGFVHLNGKMLFLAAATGLTLPSYIRESATAGLAEIVTTVPSSGQFIAITTLGVVDRRFAPIRRNLQNGEFSITGFELNTGKVSNVDARRSTDQSVPSNTFTVVSYNTENVDELNEFAIAGEFTPQQAGLYMIDLTLRVFSSTNNNSIDIVAQRETSPGSGSFVDNNANQFTFVNGVFFTTRLFSTIRLQAQQRTRHRIRFQNASGVVAPGTALNIVRIG